MRKVKMNKKTVAKVLAGVMMMSAITATPHLMSNNRNEVLETSSPEAVRTLETSEVSMEVETRPSSINMMSRATTNVTSLATPTNVVVTNNDPFSVTVTFDKVEGATKYCVYYTDSNGIEKAVEKTTNKVTIAQLVPGETYTYRVEAMTKYRQVVSEQSAPVTNVNLIVEAPEITVTSLTQRDDGLYTYDINFNPITYMSDCNLYMCTDGVSFIKKASALAKSGLIRITGLEQGQTYYIKIQALKRVNDQIEYTPYSETLVVSIPMDEVEVSTEQPVVETPVDVTVDQPQIEIPTEVTEESEEEIIILPTVELTDEEKIALDGRMPAGNTYEAHCMAYDILDMVNAERASRGVAPLTMDPTYLEIASIRSQELVQSYSHTRPDGSSWSVLIRSYIPYPGACGENIAWGYRTASGFYGAWYKSNGHLRNMVSRNYNYVGIYIYKSPETGYYYATQDFGKYNK